MKEFMIRGGDLILPECGGTVAFPRGVTLAARLAPSHWARVGRGAPTTNAIGVSIVRGGINPGTHRFRPRIVGVVSNRFHPRIVEVVDVWKGSYPGMGSSPRARRNSTSPSHSAISQWCWGFHTVRGGVDPGGHRFRPRFVGVVEV